jgi:hypothetical protein
MPKNLCTLGISMPRMRPCSVAMKGSAAAVSSKVAQLATSAMTSSRMAPIDSI